MSELTHLLRKVQAGDVGARETLFAAAYSDLERLARARLRDGGRSTLLDTRGLVHESYLRYLQGGELRAEDRRAFFNRAEERVTAVPGVLSVGFTLTLPTEGAHCRRCS